MKIVDSVQPLDEDHIKRVCKIGQASSCCKYLIMGAGGFECAKVGDIGVKTYIDRRTDMVAKSDNCEGRAPMVKTEDYHERQFH